MTPGQRAAVTAAGQVELEGFELPPPRAGQVLLRALTSLISPGTERAFFLGLDNAQAAYPLASRLQLGWRGCGMRRGRHGPARGRPRRLPGATCLAGSGRREGLLARSGWAAGSDEAAFFNLLAIAMQGIRKARIELGEPVAVLGAGLIGVLAMRLAQLCGGLPVIGIDLDAARLTLAKRLGADATIVSSDDVSQHLRELLGEETARLWSLKRPGRQRL